MPPPTSNPEALAAALIEKPGPPSTATETRGADIRKKAREASPREAIRDIAKPKPIDKVRADQLIDNNIGVERDVTTGAKVRSVAEQARFTDINSWKWVAQELLEGKYNTLTAVNQTLVRDDVERALRAWTAADSYLSTLGPADRQAAIESLIKNPDFIAKIRATYEEVTDQDKSLPDETLLNTQKKVSEQDAQFTNTNTDLAGNAGKITAVETQLDRFRTIGGVVGADQQTINDIVTEMPTLTANLATRNAELTVLKAEQRAFEMGVRAGTTPPADLAAKIGEVAAKEAEIKTTQDRINLKDQLEQKRTDLQQQRSALDQERNNLTSKRDQLNIDISKGRADLASARVTREAQEKQFQDSVRGIISEGTFQYMEEQVKALEATERKLIEQQIAVTGDPAEKAVLQGLLKLFDKKDGKYDKNNIEAYYKSLVAPNTNPRILLGQVLREGGFTVSEIDDKLKDPDFINKMQSQVIERIITRRLQTGKITEGEVRIIAESDWGAGMIDKAIQNRNDVQEMINKLKGDGIISGSPKEWLTKMKNPWIIRLLLILLAGAAISTFGITGLAGVAAKAGATAWKGAA